MPLNEDLATALKMAARAWEVGKSVAFLIGRRYAVPPSVDNK